MSPLSDDGYDQFENYLRQFDPLPPPRLRFETGSARALPQAITAWAAMAALVIVAWMMLYPRAQRANRPDHGAPWAGSPAGSARPLTVQSANALLNRAPSFKEAVEALASPSHETSSERQQSAFSVLSKDAKL